MTLDSTHELGRTFSMASALLILPPPPPPRSVSAASSTAFAAAVTQCHPSVSFALTHDALSLNLALFALKEPNNGTAAVVVCNSSCSSSSK